MPATKEEVRSQNTEVRSEATFADIQRAADRIKPLAKRTPVMTSRSFDDRSGVAAFFKCENLQTGGAFKIRGASNFVFSIPADELPNVCHSCGKVLFPRYDLEAVQRSVSRDHIAEREAIEDVLQGRVTVAYDASESRQPCQQRDRAAALGQRVELLLGQPDLLDEVGQASGGRGEEVAQSARQLLIAAGYVEGPAGHPHAIEAVAVVLLQPPPAAV